MADGFGDRVLARLAELGWSADADPGTPGGYVLDRPEGTDWPVVVQIGPDDETLALYSLLDEEVAAAHRNRVAAVTLEANYGLSAGCFEIDLADGDTRFRTDLDLRGVDLSDEQLTALLRRTVADNLAGMALWYDPLTAAAAG